MKKSRVLFMIIAILLVSVYIVYNYMYQDHRDIAKEKVAHSITSNALKKAYETNSSDASKKFLDQTISVRGIVTEINNDTFTLDKVILCYTDSLLIASLQIDTEVTVKGRVIGYDELLEIVKIDQTTITNN